MTRHVHFGILVGMLAAATVSFDSLAQGKALAQVAPTVPTAGGTPSAGVTLPGAPGATGTAVATGAATGGTPVTPTLDATLDALLGRAGGLTADTVGKRAAATSFDVKARMDELEAAAAAVDEALIAYFPRLELTGRYTRLSDIPAGSLGTLLAGPAVVTSFDQITAVPISLPVLLNQYTLQASLSVPLSDYILRIPQAHAAASHSERAASLSADATRLKTAADGKALYYTWVRAKLQQVVAEQALDQARAHLTDVKHAFDAGVASRADVLRLESQVAQSELLVERSRNQADLYEIEVRVAMHDASEAPYEIAERLDEEHATLAGGDVALAAMWSEARERRLEVRALSETADSFQDQGSVARAGYWPRVSAFGDAVYQNPNARYFPQQDQFNGTWDAGVQLTIVPNDMARASTSGHQLDARVAETIAQREALFDGVRTEVTQARQSRREAEVSLDTTRRGLVSAEESYRVRRSLFQHGRATAVELTDAETDLTRARLDSINARIDLRIATVRLEHALGRDAGGASR
jgi:outer membrane protein